MMKVGGLFSENNAIVTMSHKYLHIHVRIVCAILNIAID